MSCQTIQRRLFTLADPDRVPASVRNHLAECASCRELHRRISSIEHHAPLLVVPPSPYAKAALLRKIRTGPTVRDRIFRFTDHIPETFRHPGRRQLTGASLAAAALLFIVLGIRLMPGTPDASPDPGPLVQYQAPSDRFLSNVVDRQLTLAEASKPRPQTETLANLADDLNGAAQTLARATEPGDSLVVVSGWYEQVVQVEVKRAGKLPAAERPVVLVPLAQRLERAAAMADIAAHDLQAGEEHPLRKMAASARTAKEQLIALNRQDAGLLPKIEIPAPVASASAAFGRTVIRNWHLPTLTVGAAAMMPPPMPSPNEELRRFQLNREVLKALVEGSLQLAQEEDPVQRAAHCGNIAKSLAEAIQKAASDREGARVAELGRILRDQVQRGVAGNLKAAIRESAPAGSTRDQNIQQVVKDVNGFLQPLEEQLLKAPESEHLQPTLKAVHDGRGEIDQFLKGKE